jgi:hypothetical protein
MIASGSWSSSLFDFTYQIVLTSQVRDLSTSHTRLTTSRLSALRGRSTKTSWRIWLPLAFDTLRSKSNTNENLSTPSCEELAY